MANGLFDNVYNPDVLSCLANLSNDEVFTPPDIVNQMLDMLPQELFRNPDTTFLDPPYNTGARDWKYNNDYVDGADTYRHSKWLSMMEKRLKLAKRLLNPADSVLIVTIDEKEYLHQYHPISLYISGDDI